MELYSLTVILGGLLLGFILYRGAKSDLSNRTFPKEYFDKNIVYICGFFTAITYLSLIASGFWGKAVVYFFISVIAAIVFWFMGLRFGSGGDWRAMIYIALFSPFILLSTCIITFFSSAILAVYSVWRCDDNTPRLYRTVPFAVAIFVGYVAAVCIFVISNL